MPVLGAVVTLPEHCDSLLTALKQHPNITLGAPDGVRQPLVLTSTDRAQDRDLWKWIQSQPDVKHIELVFADFSDLHEEGQ